jgi:hypothetical protein
VAPTTTVPVTTSSIQILPTTTVGTLPH